MGGRGARAALAAAARPQLRPAANAIASGFGGHQRHARRGRRVPPSPALPTIWGGCGCARARAPPRIQAGWPTGRVAVRCARVYLSPYERNDDPRRGVSRGTPEGGRETGREGQRRQIVRGGGGVGGAPTRERARAACSPPSPTWPAGGRHYATQRHELVGEGARLNCCVPARRSAAPSQRGGWQGGGARVPPPGSRPPAPAGQHPAARAPPPSAHD